MTLSVVQSLERSTVPLSEVLKVLHAVAEDVAAERISEACPTMVLRRWVLTAALAQDAGLRSFMLETNRHAESALFILKADELPGLVPVELHRCPLWYFRLPAVLEPHLEQLASEDLSAVVCFSRDLMRADVYAIFEVGTLSVRFRVDKSALDSLPSGHRNELPGVLLLWTAGRSLILSVYPVSVGAEMGLYGSGSCAGENYRPYRLFSDEEIKEAQERVKREGPYKPTVLSNGQVKLELTTYVSDAYTDEKQ